MLDREGLGSGSSNTVELLFLASYQPSSDNLWQAMVTLGTITMVFSGPVYICLLKLKKVKSSRAKAGNNNSTEGSNAEKENSVYEHHDLINSKSRNDEEKVSRHTRIIISYLVLAVMCLIPIGINFGLLFVANHRSLKVQFLPCRLAASCQNGTQQLTAASPARRPNIRA
jgi:hypothetical protein